MSDVADSGPRNCQADCVYTQMQENLGGGDFAHFSQLHQQGLNFKNKH